MRKIIVSDQDILHLSLIRENVTNFIMKCAQKFDSIDCVLLDIAPQDHNGANEFFEKSKKEELLLPLWPKECADLSRDGRRHIIQTLERALRAERRRGRAGHWAYDLRRHAALVKSWREECAALKTIDATKSPPGGGRFKHSDR